MKVIIQAEATECGLAALAMVASHYGLDVGLVQLRQQHAPSLKGATLRDIVGIADELGLSARAVRLELDDLENLRLPAILHWDMNHFVVLAQVRRGKALINDPARGQVRLPLTEVSKHFTGVALELTPTATFEPKPPAPRTKITDLWSRMSGLPRALAQIGALSVMLQALTLVLPLFLQITVDEAVARYDQSFLVVLALGFGFLYVLNGLSEALRSIVILLIGQSMTFQMAGNVLRHLMRLPTDFFEKRHVGDVVSRMMAVQPIQTALTQSVISALIDGVMAITTGVLIVFYNWRLALVVFATTLVYAALSIAVFPMMRRKQEELIVNRAAEQSFTIETIHGARAIKLFGGEADREAGWRNAFTKVVNATVQFEKFEIGLKMANAILFGVQIVLVVFVGANLILAGSMTVGMLFAFMAYRQNFVDRIGGLVEKGIEFRMLGLHLDRLSDIVQTPREQGLETSIADRAPLKGDLTLNDVSFRYGARERFVFENVQLDIGAGDFVAITGPSGCGKSTLLKVMLGLLKPEDGEVRLDGRPLDAFGLRAFRASIGVVMQDDKLLSGTIAENISFFDPAVDMDRIAEAAEQARVHAEITQMPMGYMSYIGDMGAALSGGQRQRLMLARALYRKPRMLFLDEGTANLDETSEREIGAIISDMNITRIVVAHRPELIRRAARVLRFKDGQFVEGDAARDAKLVSLAE